MKSACHHIIMLILLCSMCLEKLISQKKTECWLGKYSAHCRTNMRKQTTILTSGQYNLTNSTTTQIYILGRWEKVGDSQKENKSFLFKNTLQCLSVCFLKSCVNNQFSVFCSRVVLPCSIEEVRLFSVKGFTNLF